MSREREAQFALMAKEYAGVIEEIEKLTRNRHELETAEMHAHDKRRALAQKLSGFVGSVVRRRAVALGSRTLVVDWQSDTSPAEIHLVETVAG